jgi:hypothetical protein
VYKGSFTGTFTESGTQVIHKNEPYVGWGIETCAASCSIRGRTDAWSATYYYAGRGSTYTGSLTFTVGYGKLAGLRGGGSFSSNAKGNVYSYKYKL